MNDAPQYEKPYSFVLSRSRSGMPPYEDDARSITPEPSLTLTNSVSFNSSSTSSFHRDRDYGDTCDHFSPPIRLPFVSPPSSLLDIDRDESLASPEDEDISLDNDVQFHSPVPPIHTSLETETTSFMEQTENSLANISETLTGSFCNQVEISNCCVLTERNDDTNNKALYSDNIVRNRLMEDMSYLLGNDTAPCWEERDLFCNFFFTPPSSEEVGFEAELGGSRIRNRAGESWRARAYRIKRLRESRNVQDMYYPEPIQGIRQSYSMDGLSHQGKMKQNSSDIYSSQQCRARNLKPKHEINADPLGCIIGDCIEPILNLEGEENELEVVWKEQQHEVLLGEDLCYDSDPGESSCRDFHTAESEATQQNISCGNIRNDQGNKHGEEDSVTWRKPPPTIPLKRRRRMHFDSILESNSDDDSCHDDCTDDGVGNNGVHSSLTEHYDNPQPNRYDDNDVHQDADAGENLFWDGGPSTLYTKNNVDSGWELDMIRNIQDALNRTWTLTWHPTSGDFPNKSAKATSESFRSPLRTIQTNQLENTSATAMPPRCIQLWFERGNRIRRNDIVEPKLMWREAYHPDLASKRKLNKSSTEGPHQVCLLGICRILEATSSLDRKKYPFAKKSCSFLIRTCDDNEYVFEARSTELREQILNQWKLVVARLASQAVVGDGEGMVGEFFVPTSFAVP